MSQTKYLKGACTQCGGHIEFPAESAGSNIDCPHCGKPTDLLLLPPKEEPGAPRAVLIWSAIAVVILVLGLAGALAALNRARGWAERQRAAQAQAARQTEAAPTEPAVPAPEDPAAKAGFSSGRITFEKTPGSSLVYASGTLTNATDRQRFGVTLELELLDAAGKKIGAAQDYQQVLEPKAAWQFKALVVDSKAVSARIAAVKEQK